MRSYRKSAAWCPHCTLHIYKRSAKGSECAVHLIHRGAVPLQHKARLRQPSIGEGLMRRKVGETASIERTASEALPLPGGAKPGAGRGGVGGVHPSAQFPARTAASDGQRAFTRAARSAGLRFAMRSLFSALDRGINKVRRPGWHLIHRKRSPFSTMHGFASPQ